MRTTRVISSASILHCTLVKALRSPGVLHENQCSNHLSIFPQRPCLWKLDVKQTDSSALRSCGSMIQVLQRRRRRKSRPNYTPVIQDSIKDTQGDHCTVELKAARAERQSRLVAELARIICL